ncbi:MAG: hypothetical protein ACYDA4_03865 [Ignavibacteriaceae bacterium]
MEGWIKLHRQVCENEFWFSERFTKAQAWIDLLLLANHKPNILYIRGNEVKTNIGELCYSEVSLAKRWKWNRRTVDKFLSMLSKREMIHSRKTFITTIISIKNYKLYQGTTQQSAQQSSSRMHTNKNDKNEKNINRRKIKNLFSIENLPQNLNGQSFYNNKYFYVTKDFRDELFQKLADKNLTEDSIKSEFYKMESWLEANGAKKNYKLFIINWLSKVKPQQVTDKFNFHFREGNDNGQDRN